VRTVSHGRGSPATVAENRGGQGEERSHGSDENTDLSKDRTLNELSACPDCTKVKSHADRPFCGPQTKGPQRKRSVWFSNSVQSRHTFNLVGVLSFLDPELIFQRSPAPSSSPPLLHSPEKGSDPSGTTKLERSGCWPSELSSIKRSSKGRRDSFDSSSPTGFLNPVGARFKNPSVRDSGS